MSPVKEKISMKEIAKIAGVSVATVSRVLSDKGGYSEEVKNHVLGIVEKYHFRPNQLARGLRTNIASMIGVIIPDISNEYYSKIIVALQAALFEKGYLITVCNVNDDPELERKQIDALLAQNVSGLILISETLRESNLDHVDVPIVYADRRPLFENDTNSLYYVESDNYQGGYIATKELMDCGCQNILFLTDAKIESSRLERFKGYKSALKDAGVEITKKNIIKIPKATWDWKKVSEIMETRMRENFDFDGVFCVTDMMAVGVINAMQRLGLQISKDIKVVGYDDVSISELVSITTIHQNAEAIGRQSAELLINLIENEVVDKRKYSIPVSLIKRSSTSVE